MLTWLRPILRPSRAARQQVRNPCDQGLWSAQSKKAVLGPFTIRVRGYKMSWTPFSAMEIQSHITNKCLKNDRIFESMEVFMILCPPPAHQGWTRYHKLQKKRKSGSGRLPSWHLVWAQCYSMSSSLCCCVCPRIAATSRIHIVCLWDGDEIPHPDEKNIIHWENKRPCCVYLSFFLWYSLLQ